MALFNDGPASSIEDLSGHDSQLLDVAKTEEIDVTRKLELAHEEIGVELGTLLSRLNVGVDLGVPVSGAGIDQVVVTAPLKLWHTFRALELVYRDAYYSQLNDRYARKRDEYHELAAWAHEKLIQSGIGIAQDPIARAAAPAVSAAPGALADGTYYVAAAWINRAGEEGASSPPVQITTSGSTFAAQCVQAPANAGGWNVYAGTSPAVLLLQNVCPLPIGQGWMQPSALGTASRQAGTGQAPSYMRQAPRILQRG